MADSSDDFFNSFDTAATTTTTVKSKPARRAPPPPPRRPGSGAAARAKPAAATTSTSPSSAPQMNVRSNSASSLSSNKSSSSVPRTRAAAAATAATTSQQGQPSSSSPYYGNNGSAHSPITSKRPQVVAPVYNSSAAPSAAAPTPAAAAPIAALPYSPTPVASTPAASSYYGSNPTVSAPPAAASSDWYTGGATPSPVGPPRPTVAMNPYATTAQQQQQQQPYYSNTNNNAYMMDTSGRGASAGTTNLEGSMDTSLQGSMSGSMQTMQPMQQQQQQQAPSVFVPNAAASNTGAMDTNSEYYDFENEPPLLEELGINLDHIWLKTKAVVLPSRRLQGKHSVLLDPAAIVEDADLAGPLAFALLLGMELLMRVKMQFGYIYGFGLSGCLAMTLILNLMSPTKPVSFWTVTSILGYSLLPVNVLAGVALVTQTVAGQESLTRLLAIATVLWSTTAATRLLEVGCDMSSQRYLLAYPLALLYSAFVIITIF